MTGVSRGLFCKAGGVGAGGGEISVVLKDDSFIRNARPGGGTGTI